MCAFETVPLRYALSCRPTGVAGTSFSPDFVGLIYGDVTLGSNCRPENVHLFAIHEPNMNKPRMQLLSRFEPVSDVSARC